MSECKQISILRVSLNAIYHFAIFKGAVGTHPHSQLVLMDNSFKSMIDYFVTIAK